jgi:ubiquinone/menaquinone biosynthesis C-methylase UbiE
MAQNVLIKTLAKFGLINPDKKIAKQLRRPSGRLATYVGEQMNIGNQDLYNFTLQHIDIKNGERILEIGYGNGNFYKDIFEKSPDADISGIDYSQAMYKEAVANNKEFIQAGKLDLHYNSSDIIPYQDNIFDKVFCNNVVYFWQNPEKDLSEILRVLKPGGKFFAGIRTKETMLKLPFTRYGFTMYSPQEFEEVLKQNHFKNTGYALHTEEEVEFNGELIKIDSACVFGEK